MCRRSLIATAVLSSGAVLLTAVMAMAVNWPMFPLDVAQPLGNSWGEYQYYGGAPYLHPGIDIMQPATTSVYAVKAGYVKAILTTSADLHWRVAIGDSATSAECDGWLYAHLDHWSISVVLGQHVFEGQYLGELVSWPIASFHHLHFANIRQSGVTWTSDWEFINNPLDKLVDVTDLEPPVFLPVNGGVPFAFFPDNAHSYYNVGDTLSGRVDIIARIYDKIGHPTWRLAPYSITYEIFDDTFSTGSIQSTIFTGQLFWTDNVNVTYQDDATYNTYGDYDNRDYYFIVSNTDGDSVIESSDYDGAWVTSDFGDGDWWVKVTAYDRGGNTTSDSMQVTISNAFTAIGTVVPCDGDPITSGITITAPDLPGSPQVTSNPDGSFLLRLTSGGNVRLLCQRAGYSDFDTSVNIPGDPLTLELQPDYVVGDCNMDNLPDAVDLALLIDVVYLGETGWPIPYWAGDMDFSRALDAVDIALLIDRVYFGAPPPGPPHCAP